MENSPQSNHQQLLDAVWDASADAMRITNLNGIVISVNNAYCRLTGLNRDSLTHKLFNIVYLKQLQSEYLDEYRNRISTGKILERLEKKVTFLNGTQRYLEQSNSFIEISGEKYVLSIFRDITEFMQAVDDVREGREKYKNLYRMIRLMCDNAVDMIWAKDLNNRYLFANKAMCENLLNARNTDEPVGKNDMFFAQRERDSHKDNTEWHTFGEICRDSDTVVLKSKKKERFDEYGNVKGKFLYLDVYKTPFYNENGKIIGTVGSGRDVTKEKKLEKEYEETRLKLIESEEKYRTMVEASHDIILLINTKGDFEFINKRAEKLTGFKIEDWLGKNFITLVQPDSKERAEKGFRNAMKGKHDSFETNIVDSKGEILILSLNVIPILENDNVKTIVCFGRDITEQKRAEEKLLNSEITYRSIIDSVTEAIYVQDEAGRFLDVNIAVEKMYGYKRDELIGKTPEFLSAPGKNDLKKVGKAIQDAYGGTPQRIEFWGITKDGKVFPKEVSLSAGMYFGKKVMIAVARNITERKLAEEAEISLRKQLRAVLDTVPSYIFAKDYDGNFLMVNKSLADLFKVTPEEVVGKTDADYGATPEQIQWYSKADRKVIDSGKPMLIKEERVLRTDGSLGWFQTNKVPYKHPGVEKPAILGVAVDITERKKAEEEITMLAYALKSVNECVSITDIENKIIFVNQAFLDTYGYTEKEILGRNIDILGSDKNPPDIHSIILNEALKGEWKGEFINRRKDGSEFPVYLSSTSIHDSNGKLIALIGVAEDISNRKKIEQTLRKAKENAEEMNRLKSSFLANMSHELRTPLHGILGFSEIILEKDNLEEIKSIADIIHKSGNRLLNTLNQILDLSSLEANTKKIECKFIDIMEVVKDSVELFRAEVKKKNLGLSFHSDNPSVITYSDPKIIYDTLNNLIINAISFTKKGGISIKVREEIINEKNCVVINVKDTGIGIKKADMKIIFDEFRQASEGWGRSYGGSGLGLSICKRYMDLLGGSISVTSNPGEGSDFKLVIPKFDLEDYKKIKSGSKKPDAGSKTNPAGNKKGIIHKILYVEDEADSIELVKYFIGNYFNVDSATNSKECIKKAKDNKYSLILMDISLKEGKSGLDVLAEIRKIPYYKNIPVIAVTAYAMKGDEEEFKVHGCTDYISKPFTKEILLDKISFLLKDKI